MWLRLRLRRLELGQAQGKALRVRLRLRLRLGQADNLIIELQSEMIGNMIQSMQVTSLYMCTTYHCAIFVV